MQLIIVESPTKSKTIQKFLSSDDYAVLSSFGHVRDLPVSTLGVDTEHDFEPHYIIPKKARPHVKELKEALKKSDSVILATDEDREGEAISWHLVQALKLPDSKRIVFHEITKSAIEEALENPREINMDLVDAQQARRILDRLVGYKLSPFLWKKIAKGLSAGRVQSVAVKFIVDREREIEKFNPEEYWELEAELKKQDANFRASLHAKNGEAISKHGVKTKDEADKILKDLDQAEYKITHIERKEAKRNPFPPFTTSTLQQEASKKFGMPSRMTMSIAQALYERGHITYHRTDSLNLSEQSLEAVKNYIHKKFGEKYYSARKFKTKSKGAQEAHEAIRPTSPEKNPGSIKLDSRQQKIYDLIWRRFVASQMSQAVFDATTVDISAGEYTFRSHGSILKFDGFLSVYKIKFEENELPNLSEQDILELVCLQPLYIFYPEAFQKVHKIHV